MATINEDVQRVLVCCYSSAHAHVHRLVWFLLLHGNKVRLTRAQISCNGHPQFSYFTHLYRYSSGIDIVPLLERMGASEWILKTMKETGAGYFAVAYGMYKIATPARYTVTLGGTTITINYLKKWGYIKPMPSSEQMKAMLRERGRQLRSSRAKVLAKMNLRRKGSAKSRALEEEEKK